MDTAQLSAWFQAHRTEVIMVGGAAVAGLALYKRKTGAAPAAGVTAGAVAPGTMPAGAVVPGGSYDSSAWSAYNSLQDEIGTLARQNEAARQTGAGGSGVGAGVTPAVASSLFAPTGSGQYVRYGNGTIAEVESDGSLFGFSPQEWDRVWQANGKPTPTAVSGDQPRIYTTGGNLAKRNPAESVG